MIRAASFAIALAACAPAAPQGAAQPAPPPAADAGDLNAEASRHFKAGMQKIAAKDFDGGIAELQEAQRILPHPNTIFNIAKAHEDAGHKAEAVEYYRRYLASGPRDHAEVEATIKRLEAP